MSTQLAHEAGINLGLPSAQDMRIGIVTAQWNARITEALTQGAVDTLMAAGMDVSKDLDVYHVPGAVELTFAASQLIESGSYDAVIVFGCVIKGDTPHFDYVCQSVTQGITHLNAECDIPVIFGVLTVNTLQQALDRCGGALGNKGSEAAVTAVSMVHFARAVKDNA